MREKMFLDTSTSRSTSKAYRDSYTSYLLLIFFIKVRGLMDFEHRASISPRSLHSRRVCVSLCSSLSSHLRQQHGSAHFLSHSIRSACGHHRVLCGWFYDRENSNPSCKSEETTNLGYTNSLIPPYTTWAARWVGGRFLSLVR